MKTISNSPETFESTYALIMRSEEKQRSRFEILVYTILIASHHIRSRAVRSSGHHDAIDHSAHFDDCACRLTARRLKNATASPPQFAAVRRGVSFARRSQSPKTLFSAGSSDEILSLEFDAGFSLLVDLSCNLQTN